MIVEHTCLVVLGIYVQQVAVTDAEWAMAISTHTTMRATLFVSVLGGQKAAPPQFAASKTFMSAVLRMVQCIFRPQLDEACTCASTVRNILNPSIIRGVIALRSDTTCRRVEVLDSWDEPG